MKILLFTPYSTDVFPERFPAVNGPRENRATWSENLVKYLSQFQDIEIFVATMSRLVDRDYVFEEEGVKYYYLKHPIPKAEWLFFFLFDIIKLRRVARKINPDIIHAQGTEDCYGLAAVSLKYPALLSLHAPTTELLRFCPRKLSSGYLRTRMFPFLNQYVISRSKYIHTQTLYLKNYFHNILREKIVSVLDLPVNSLYFSVVNQPQKNIIVFVGSSFKLKGADTLVKITNGLCKTVDDFEVVIIGPNTGEMRDILSRMVDEYNVGDKMRFLGQVGPAEIAHQLSLAKVFVAPTRCDTYGMAAIEALCAGVPVVSSNIMGIPYAIDNGVDGFLLDPEDVAGFVEKITLLLQNDSLREKMGQNARERAKKRWNSNLIAKTMLEIYKDILK